MKKIAVVAAFLAVAFGVSFGGAQPASARTYMTANRGYGKTTMAYVKPQSKYQYQMAYRSTAKKTAWRHTSVTNHTNVASVPTPTELWQVENGHSAGNGSTAWQNGNGKVLVNWSVRGGTCNIRYSETKEGDYKYRTSAGCDEGSHWVGALRTGEKYKFEIAQDGWSNWSGKAIAQAW